MKFWGVQPERWFRILSWQGFRCSWHFVITSKVLSDELYQLDSAVSIRS